MHSAPTFVLGRAHTRARTCRRVGILIALLLSARAATAQDSTRKWAIGADHESGIYMGIGLGARYRLEPELGIVRSHDVTQLDIGFGSTTETVTAANYRIGVGVLRQWQGMPRVRLYAGPRVGAIFTRFEDQTTGANTGVQKTRRTDLFLAGSIGAEYFPVDQVSFGADVQLRGVHQGHVTSETSGSGTGGIFLPSDPTLLTRGLLMLRVYF